MKIRKLTPVDVHEYARLRLEALQTNPESFGSDYARENGFSTADFLRRIEQGDYRFVLGAFDDGELVSTVGIYRVEDFINIWGVYTTPSHRGQKISKGLMSELIEGLIGDDDLRKVRLGVTAESLAAQALYKRMGFEVYIDEADTSCEILMELDI